MTNQEKIAQLLPIVGRQAQKLIDRCKKELGIDLLITCGYRSIEEQNKLYEIGRTKSPIGNKYIVTKAKGGQSFHQYRTAIDVCPIQGGKLLWDYDWKKIGNIGKEIGFKWGGDWVSIKDNPHFEWNLFYTLKDFQEGKVDMSKFK